MESFEKYGLNVLTGKVVLFTAALAAFALFILGSI
jgi:hypothetical protein